MIIIPDKCDECGLTWYLLRGSCPCCGGLIIPQEVEAGDSENNNQGEVKAR